jgi:hypothetical protein
MVGTVRAVFVIPVADVFIGSFNDNGASKQSQIKIIFLARWRSTLLLQQAGGNFDVLYVIRLNASAHPRVGGMHRCVIQAS